MAGYDFMEPAFAALPAAQYSAMTIACPACSAGIGESCTGPRVCRERVQAALSLVRAGRLTEAEEKPTTETADPSSCNDCGTETNQRGHAVACERPAHRCQRILSTGQQCRRVVELGGRYCGSHALRSRWN